mgnify:CR=1 FL=1
MGFNIPYTDKKRVVIIGGGFGGLKLAEKLKKSNPYLEQCRIICDSDAHYLEHIHEPEWKMKVREKSAAAVIAYLRGE